MQILYEDNHLLAVEKQSGQLVHGDHTGDITLLDRCKEYIKEKYNKPGAVFLQPVHRIDRPTSGLVLFARTSKATTRLTKAFQAKEIQKTYFAIIHQKPNQDSGTLVDHLFKDQAKNIVKVVGKTKGKYARLNYQIIKSNPKYTFLKIQPETGRSHQIRVQLSSRGYPIVGDFKYGSKQYTDGRSIHLHAYKLSFLHPTKKEQLTISCPLPQKFLWSEFTYSPADESD